MGLEKKIRASVCMEITCADMAGMLNVITKNQIPLNDISYLSEIRIRVSVFRKDVKQVRLLCEKHGGHVKTLYLQGPYWSIKAFLCRPVMIVGVLILCLIAFQLPSRVLFITVTGNERISDSYILEQAAMCGIKFGTATVSVRSEQVKNELLGHIPQLQWVGINTTGCVAEIQVKENDQEKQQTILKSNFDIRASMDAVVTYASATSGSLNCKIGQAVTTDQVLISSVLQNGDILQFTGASGEVYGDTVRKISCITPVHKQVRGIVVGKAVNYSIIIGKKLINFDNGSGIYSGSCVKMKEKSTLTLPGGFQLPVSLIKETVIYYETEIKELSDEADGLLEAYCDQYLTEHMVSGRILSGNYYVTKDDFLYTMQADYACNEMIARITDEEQSHG